MSSTRVTLPWRTSTQLQRHNSPAQALGRLSKLFFPAASDRWLTILRLGLGLQIILYCLSIKADWQHLFATHGWIGSDLAEAIARAQAPLAPRLGWLLNIANWLGIDEEPTLAAIWVCLLLSAICLAIGFFCRSAAIIGWFLHLCAVSSKGVLTYGMDNFTSIGLFYLVLAPFPDRYSLDFKVWKPPVKDPHLHGFFCRVLRLHLCIIYFFSGLAKSLGTGWWNGDSLWRALTRPPFDIIPTNAILSAHALLPIAGIAVVVLEMGYPVFIWLKRTRLAWLISVVLMHVSIGLTMGLYLFASILIILNLAAFGPEIIFCDRVGDDYRPATAN